MDNTFLEIPLSWRMVPPDSVVPVFTSNMALPTNTHGNEIDAFYGFVKFEGIANKLVGSSYIRRCTIRYNIVQGAAQDMREYEAEGPFHPGERYEIWLPISTQFLPSRSEYLVEVTDVDNAFKNASITLSNKIPFTINTVTPEVVKDIIVSGEKIYEDINVSWTQESQNDAELELWQGGSMIWKSRLTKGKSVTIPSGTIKKTDDCIAKIRTRLVILGSVFWSEYATTEITRLEGLSVTKPSSFEVLGRKIYENIKVSWRTTPQHEYYAAVFVNESRKLTKGWTTDGFIDIPYGTIPTTDDVVKVKVKSRAVVNGYVTESEEVSYTVSSLQGLSVQSPTGFEQSSKKIYEDIKVTWTGAANHQYYCTLTINSQTHTTKQWSRDTFFDIPKGTIKSTSDVVKLKVKSKVVVNGYVKESEEVSHSVSGLQNLVVQAPTGFEMSSKKIYENIKVTWKNSPDHQYYCTLLINNEQKNIKSWSSESFYDIRYGTIKSASDTVKLKVRSRISSGGYTEESDDVLYTLSSLQDLTISAPRDVRFVGTQQIIEQPIKIAWTNDDTYNVVSKIELWQNGMKIHEKDNISSTEYTISAGVIQSVNQVQVRVYNTKSVNGYTATSSYGSMTLSSLTSFKPAIRDFTLNGSNRDYDIKVTPDVDRGDTFSLLINGSKKIDSLTIPKGTLNVGSNTIKLTVTASSGVDIPVTSSYQKTVTNIVENTPLVYSLEPSGINTNIEKNNDVTFSTNEFCDSWQLFINGSRYTTGTTQRSVTIPAKTFRMGENNITIQTTYSPPYYNSTKRNASRSSTFNGYSKPRLPKLDSTSVYNTATPNFTWTCASSDPSDVQTEVTIIVKRADNSQQIEKRTLNTTSTSYQCSTPLDNNTRYTVSVSIKNKFGLWSDYATKTFETSFTSIGLPGMNITTGKTSVTINCYISTSTSISELKLFRREQYGEWVCIASKLSTNDNVTDYAVRSNIPTQYKVRAVSTNGSYTDSHVKEVTISYDGYMIADVKDISNFYKTLCCDVSIVHNRTIVNKLFAGNRTPDVYYDNTNYLTGTLKMQLNSKDLYYLESMIISGDVFCYKDWRGRKFYCTIVMSSVDYVKFSNIYNVSLSFTEVNFVEEDMYSRNRDRKVVYLDGSYRLDGTASLDGYVLDDRGEVFVDL